MSQYQSMLVVDDHQIVSSGIQLILHAYKINFEIENCSNGEACIEILSGKKIDVIVMDVNLPDTDTFQLVKSVLELYPKQKILIYSMSSEKMYKEKFLELGVKDFVNKQASNGQFVKALRTVLNTGNSSIIREDIEIDTTEKISNSHFRKLDNKNSYQQQENIKSTFFVRHKGTYQSIQLKDVIFFKVDGRYIRIHCQKEIFSLRTSLSSLEKRIESGFVRVNGTILVNENKIFSLDPKAQKVYLKNGDVIPFSRHFKKNLVQSIKLVRP